MREPWELLTAGPPDADRSVLLLPGRANAARSFNLVMADPELAGVHLVATTVPGMAGAPVSEDMSIPALSRRAGELAKELGCDVVVGFSHGAPVAPGHGGRANPRIYQFGHAGGQPVGGAADQPSNWAALVSWSRGRRSQSACITARPAVYAAQAKAGYGGVG